MASEIIYVELLDEGTAVWRPVEAELLSHGIYRILGDISDDENWSFEPGDVVEVRQHVFSDGSEGMIAVRQVEKVQITARQQEYVSGLIVRDSSFADLIRSHPNIQIKDDAIVLDRSDATILSDYFSDQLAKVGFDAEYQPNEEGVVIESLIDALFSIIGGQ